MTEGNGKNVGVGGIKRIAPFDRIRQKKPERIRSGHLLNVFFKKAFYNRWAVYYMTQDWLLHHLHHTPHSQ